MHAGVCAIFRCKEEKALGHPCDAAFSKRCARDFKLFPLAVVIAGDAADRRLIHLPAPHEAAFCIRALSAFIRYFKNGRQCKRTGYLRAAAGGFAEKRSCRHE